MAGSLACKVVFMIFPSSQSHRRLYRSDATPPPFSLSLSLALLVHVGRALFLPFRTFGRSPCGTCQLACAASRPRGLAGRRRVGLSWECAEKIAVQSQSRRGTLAAVIPLSLGECSISCAPSNEHIFSVSHRPIHTGPYTHLEGGRGGGMEERGRKAFANDGRGEGLQIKTYERERAYAYMYYIWSPLPGRSLA